MLGYLDMKHPCLVDLQNPWVQPPPTLVDSWQFISEMQLETLSVLLELSVTGQARVLSFAAELMSKTQAHNN